MADKKRDETPVEVIALARGHDGRRSVEAGEKFSVPAYRLTDGSTWFVEEAKFKPAPPPSTLARPPGAGPLRGSAVRDEESHAPGMPGAGPNSAPSNALA